MAKDPFLLVSLEESESKALAQVISNDTARKILDLLSKEDGAPTETDIAKKLDVPLSTVHYNLQALLKANLVETEEFHYSEKGKEVLHYSLSNKLIIIAPKKTNSESFRDKLRALLPVGAIALGSAALIQLGTIFRPDLFRTAGRDAAIAGADIAMKASAPEVASDMMIAVAQESAPQITLQPIIAFWFLLGTLFTMLLLVVWYFFTSKK